MKRLLWLLVSSRNLLLTWQQRHYGQGDLHNLNNRLLEDIGLNRTDVARQASERVWYV
jgi:uncharacterized protein YjiS (DUF1127 family)